MSLTRVIDPVDPVVSLPDIKVHCRVLHADEDAALQGYVAAAVAHLDGYGGALGFCLGLQTWELTYDAFPAGPMELPLGPVTEIASITYLDAAGVAVVLPPAAYEVDVTGGDGWVGAVDAWPATGVFFNAVRVRFVCGHAVVPKHLGQIVKMLAGCWYDNRGGEMGIPAAVAAMITAHRRMSV